MLQYRIGNIAEEALDVFSDKWKCFAAEAAIERFLFLMKRISESRKQHESNVSIQAIVEQLLLSFMGEI